METVMDCSITHGYRLDNPAGRALLRVLPPVHRLKRHHPSLPYDQVPGALALVRESIASPLTKLAFEFLVLVLTAARRGEVRGADWTEVDWNKPTWRIPEHRMKPRLLHRVPLADRSIEILRATWETSGPAGLIFPAVLGDKEAPI